MRNGSLGVLITGAEGFIGKNLIVHLQAMQGIDVLTFTREHDLRDLSHLLKQTDCIIHLAGTNRPKDSGQFALDNQRLTKHLCDAVKNTGRVIPIIFSSSIQATTNNHYGESKLAAERILLDFQTKSNNPVFIFRLPNVFGKWARPNYNSVVATFCFNTINDIPIDVHDANANLTLVYIDDVIKEFVSYLGKKEKSSEILNVSPEYNITVGELAKCISEFKEFRKKLLTKSIGLGLYHELYATYVSYLPYHQFCYDLDQHGDDRGIFVEMLRTSEFGQISFFTSKPGVVRGGHYHHSKTEKFLVVKGCAQFRFHHILTNEKHEVTVSAEKPQIIESVPGWAHDIKNSGDEELICILWANEVFDKKNPDTIMFSIKN